MNFFQAIILGIVQALTEYLHLQRISVFSAI